MVHLFGDWVVGRQTDHIPEDWIENFLQPPLEDPDSDDLNQGKDGKQDDEPTIDVDSTKEQLNSISTDNEPIVGQIENPAEEPSISKRIGEGVEGSKPESNFVDLKEVRYRARIISVLNRENIDLLDVIPINIYQGGPINTSIPTVWIYLRKRSNLNHYYVVFASPHWQLIADGLNLSFNPNVLKQIKSQMNLPRLNPMRFFQQKNVDHGPSSAVAIASKFCKMFSKRSIVMVADAIFVDQEALSDLVSKMHPNPSPRMLPISGRRITNVYKWNASSDGAPTPQTQTGLAQKSARKPTAKRFLPYSASPRSSTPRVSTSCENRQPVRSLPLSPVPSTSRTSTANEPIPSARPETVSFRTPISLASMSGAFNSPSAQTSKSSTNQQDFYSVYRQLEKYKLEPGWQKDHSIIRSLIETAQDEKTIKKLLPIRLLAAAESITSEEPAIYILVRYNHFYIIYVDTKRKNYIADGLNRCLRKDVRDRISNRVGTTLLPVEFHQQRLLDSSPLSAILIAEEFMRIFRVNVHIPRALIVDPERVKRFDTFLSGTPRPIRRPSISHFCYKCEEYFNDLFELHNHKFYCYDLKTLRDNMIFDQIDDNLGIS